MPTKKSQGITWGLSHRLSQAGYRLRTGESRRMKEGVAIYGHDNSATVVFQYDSGIAEYMVKQANEITTLINTWEGWSAVAEYNKVEDSLRVKVTRTTEPGRVVKEPGSRMVGIGDRVEIKVGLDTGGWGIVKAIDADYCHVAMYGNDNDVRAFTRSEIRKGKQAAK